MEEASQLWTFMIWGYLLTVALETPVLLLGLAPRHSLRRRLLASFWLTACTYPIVAVVLPIAMSDSSTTAYLIVAETYAPVMECVLFWLAFPVGAPTDKRPLVRSTWLRDGAAIVTANLCSFGIGELLRSVGWIG